MYYVLICPVGAVAGKEALLTYHCEQELAVGSIVRIPFGRTEKTGVIVNATSKPDFQTKAVLGVLDESLPQHLLDLATWMSEYYAARLPIVLQTILPSGLEKKRRPQTADNKQKIRRANNLAPLTAAQHQAIESIQKSRSVTSLLHGVTGSGKTRVYQELSKQILDTDKSVLVLVPEIALTPQLAAEFEMLHDNVLVMHSGLSESERHHYWSLLSRSKKPWVVVGPRSSLFVPLSTIGLIIVDECHEPSYQQDSQPKYSALRVARKLADLSPNSKLVLGSATPLVTDYFIANQTGTPIVELEQPVSRRDTTVEVIDIRDRSTFGTHPIFSKQLLEKMNNTIAQNNQILLFHNRRGTARMSLCSSCGWVAECTVCHIPMRLHHDKAELRCHVCGRSDTLPQVCPDCGHPGVDFKGFGSKRIEAEVRKLYPNVHVARFDSDTPKKEQLHHRYQELYDGTIQIIIGTQGIAKGLDLPHLTTVGIVQADSELFIPDFSSSERSFQLTTQVIGRAGRNGQKSDVIIQTLNPDHPAILYASAQDYRKFYEHELNERSAEHMPPHTYLLHLTTGYASAAAAEKAADKLRQAIKTAHPGVHIRGPSPAFHEHRGKKFYQQLVVGSSRRGDLVAIAEGLPQRWQFTLDPLNLL